jgi:hypothetical protein
MVKRPAEGWRTFVRNHSADIAAWTKPMGIAAFDIGALRLCQLEAFQSAQRSSERLLTRVREVGTKHHV